MSEVKKRQRIEWRICRKVRGVPWPGKWWTEAENEEQARLILADYGPGFRLCRVIVEDAPRAPRGKTTEVYIRGRVGEKVQPVSRKLGRSSQK